MRKNTSVDGTKKTSKTNLNTNVFVVADLLTDYLYMEMYHLVIAFAHVNIHCKILD